jgi:hypothetical protein
VSVRCEILPNSLASDKTRGVVFRDGEPYLPLYCANCNKDSGTFVRDTELPDNFAFYLCDPCGDKWGGLAGYMLSPDEAFWATVKAEQIEKYGRELSGDEVATALTDSEHVLSKLARDRYSSYY